MSILEENIYPFYSLSGNDLLLLWLCCVLNCCKQKLLHVCSFMTCIAFWILLGCGVHGCSVNLCSFKYWLWTGSLWFLCWIILVFFSPFFSWKESKGLFGTCGRKRREEKLLRKKVWGKYRGKFTMFNTLFCYFLLKPNKGSFFFFF